MLRAIYNALWWIVAPLAVLRLLIRSRKERGYREHIGERFGHTRGVPCGFTLVKTRRMRSP